MSKLQELISLAKFGISIDIDRHKTLYINIKSYMTGSIVPDDVLKKIIESNTVVEILAYTTNVSFPYAIYHHDFEAAISEIIELIKNDKK
jgi:hypothetical protein